MYVILSVCVFIFFPGNLIVDFSDVLSIPTFSSTWPVPLISQCIVILLVWLQVLIPGYRMSENLKLKTIRAKINQSVSESLWTWRHMSTEDIKYCFTLKQPLNQTLQRNSNAVLLKPTLISLNLFAHSKFSKNLKFSCWCFFQMAGFISYGSYPPKEGSTSHSLEMTALYGHKRPDNTQ